MFRRRRRRRGNWHDWALVTGSLIIGAGTALAIVLLAGCEAHAQEPPAVFPVPPQAETMKDEEVNAPGKPKCVCALGGDWGGCFTRPALLRVRDAATTKRESLQVQLIAKKEELSAVQGALAACKAQATLLGAANLDRKAAVDLAQKPVATVPRSWWDRHGVGVAAAIGLAVGAGVTLGLVYGLKPAVGSSSAKLLPLVRF